MTTSPGAGVAVLVPCHNEEATVGRVVRDFQEALPGCLVVVADNASTDATRDRALDAGARVISETRPGKGYAIRRLFADVEADVYVMVDGDDTYGAAASAQMVELVRTGGFDMVNGLRVTVEGHDDTAYRPGHEWGNEALTRLFQRLFALDLEDTLSGYRAMSRRFVKTFPSGATGFEIEAELNAHAATLGVPVSEVPTEYRSRPEGSHSKLNTYRDGVRILRRNLRLFRDARPGLAFFLLAIPWAMVALPLMWTAFAEYFRTGVVTRFPSLIAGVGFLVVSLLLVVAGIIMERVARNRIEVVRLAYLTIPSPLDMDARPSDPATSRQHRGSPA
jgi:glycosyltransferase involved in cell wall biosynthesis